MTDDVLASDLRTWAAGWAIARGTAAPAPLGAGSYLSIGVPGREFEIVGPYDAADPGAAEAVAAWTAHARVAGGIGWLTLVGPDAAASLAALGDAGLDPEDRHEAFMSVALTAGAPAVPDGYTIEVDRAGDRLAATARAADGAIAASGAAGLVGDAQIADRILTEPAHRRRGLGTAIMAALAVEARAAGAHRGLLVASAEGRTLYGALGWTVRGEVAVGRTGPIPLEALGT